MGIAKLLVKSGLFKETETSEPVVVNTNVDKVVKKADRIPVKNTYESVTVENSAPGDTEIDPKVVEHIDKVFSDANIPGPDYFEFMQSLDEMESIIPDETSRYKAAYIPLSKQGLTPEKLLSTAGQYVTILQKELTDFNDAAQRNLDSLVGNSEKEIETLTAQNEELKAQLSKNEIQIQALASSVEADKQKAKHTTYSFNRTCEALLSQINEHIGKIKAYIK